MTRGYAPNRRRLLVWIVMLVCGGAGIVLWPDAPSTDVRSAPTPPKGWVAAATPEVPNAREVAAWHDPKAGASLTSGIVARDGAAAPEQDVRLALSALADPATARRLKIHTRTLATPAGAGAVGWTTLAGRIGVAQAWIPHEEGMRVSTAAAKSSGEALAVLEGSLGLAPAD